MGEGKNAAAAAVIKSGRDEAERDGQRGDGQCCMLLGSDECVPSQRMSLQRNQRIKEDQERKAKLQVINNAYQESCGCAYFNSNSENREV